MVVEGRTPRSGRFLGKFLILGTLVALVAAAGAFWPQISTAVTAEGGVFRRAKRRFDLWRGIAQGSDPRIKRVIKNLDRPVGGGPPGGGCVKGVTRY